MNLFNITEMEELHANGSVNDSTPNMNTNGSYLDVMDIARLCIAPVGIIGNLTVILVFLSHRKLRRKIPNKFIVNQVRTLI